MISQINEPNLGSWSRTNQDANNMSKSLKDITQLYRAGSVYLINPEGAEQWDGTNYDDTLASLIGVMAPRAQRYTNHLVYDFALGGEIVWMEGEEDYTGNGKAYAHYDETGKKTVITTTPVDGDLHIGQIVGVCGQNLKKIEVKLTTDPKIYVAPARREA